MAKERVTKHDAEERSLFLQGTGSRMFRATGMTTHLKNGGTMEKARYVPGRRGESAPPVALYDQRQRAPMRNLVERISV